MEHEEEVFRDYLEGPEAQDALFRKSMKNIWTVEDVTDVDWKQEEPERSFFEVLSKYRLFIFYWTLSEVFFNWWSLI